MKKVLVFILMIFFCSCSSQVFNIGKKDILKQPNVNNSLGMEFVYIGPGDFSMGIPHGSFGYMHGKNPLHKVTLTKGYYIMTTEVTQGQWVKIMNSNPSHFKDCGLHCPVESVSWIDVQDFIEKLNKTNKEMKYRLPTEAEWEYAARAGTNTPYSFGNCLSDSNANFNATYPTFLSTKCPLGKYRKRPIAVASLQKNSWGLYDMHGNVAEWCQDNFGERPKLNKLSVDPQGPPKGLGRKVNRGGSWGSEPQVCLSSFSNAALEESRNYYTGFRLVMIKQDT